MGIVTTFLRHIRLFDLTLLCKMGQIFMIIIVYLHSFGKNLTTAEEGSWRYELAKAGYTCPLANCDIKGLGDYSKIVSVWVSHIEKKVADNDAMYDPDAEEE